MFTTSLTRRAHRRRIRIQQRRPLGHTGLGCSLAASLLIAGAAIMLLFSFTSLTYDLPSLQAIPSLLEPPEANLLHPTRLLDRSGRHTILTLEYPTASEKVYLFYDKTQANHIPVALEKATIASIEPAFWSSSGAAWEGIFSGEHPTLAQRLVYELLLREEPPGLRRNIRERLLALQITTHFGREKILEWYSNISLYNRWVYGADAAARVFLGKSAIELNLAEAAFLAAIAEEPTMNPWNMPEQINERQKRILRDMLIQGLISADEAYMAGKEIVLLQEQVEINDIAPAFTDFVLEELSRRIPREQLELGGWEIFTTLDYNLQIQASCAIQVYLGHADKQDESQPLDEDTSCKVDRLLQSTVNEEIRKSAGLAATAVILDPKSGQILAMAGPSIPGLDPAHAPGRPGGALLLPFIYLTAFSHGMSPASLIWDIPRGAAAVQGNNQAEPVYHGPLRLRTAMSNDYLEPAQQLLSQFGVDTVMRTAKQFGLLSSYTTTPQNVQFDQTQVVLLEAVQAFGIFANQGILAGFPQAGSALNEPIKPSGILRVIDIDRRTWLDMSIPQSQPVVSPQLTYLVNHVLSDEASRWPSLGHPNALEIGRPVAAKIGRSASGRDTWTVGYTPNLVVGVWAGQTMPGEPTIPPDAAAIIWRALIQYASQSLPAQAWNMPTGISSLDVCDPSGLLPTLYCPNIVTEVFLNGNEPTQADNLYRLFEVNRKTNRLATVFTPPELIEERVYLVAPPEAAEWARQAGLPIPPDTYDAIYTLPTNNPDVNITAPEMFSHVRGEVVFRGSANGRDFKFFRLEVGKGLNPQEWLQIGQDAAHHIDTSKPVRQGILGSWNTAGLSGLYAVQLTVIHLNNRLEQTIIQVTIDNQPPEISILSPSEQQSFSPNQPTPLIFLIAANDNLELAQVSIYLDDVLLTTFSQPPYLLAWRAQKGKHILRAQATDRAGNTNEASVRFSIEK